MSNNNPKVSIVLTSYNHERFLKQSIESLLNQSYQDFELIIVDDNSNDNSQLILNEYRNTAKIKLKLNKHNSGSYVNTTNFGATMAKGEYLLFAQCDDFSEPNQLEKLVEKAILHKECGVIFSSSSLINEFNEYLGNDFEGRESSFKDFTAKDSIIPGKHMASFLSYSCVIPNLSAALIHRALFNSVDGLSTEYKVVADWDLWFKLSTKTDFYYIREPLNNFRQHSKTIRSSISIQRQMLEIVDMLNKHHLQIFKNSKSWLLKKKVGLGAIWFSYFLGNKREWVLSYNTIRKAISKHLGFSLLFLITGGIKVIYQHIIRKHVKKQQL